MSKVIEKQTLKNTFVKSNIIYAKSIFETNYKNTFVRSKIIYAQGILSEQMRTDCLIKTLHMNSVKFLLR